MSNKRSLDNDSMNYERDDFSAKKSNNTDIDSNTFTRLDEDDVEMQNYFNPPANSFDADDFSIRKIIDEFIYLYEMLDTIDSKENKPNYSYTELVFLSIIRSPNFCLPIHEIYRYVETRFCYFKNPKRQHWKNAVRHSLSKTRCFTKIGTDSVPKKSGIYNRSSFLWTVIPRSIVKFARGEYRPYTDGSSGINTLKWAFTRVDDAQQFWDFIASGVARRIDSLKSLLIGSKNPIKIFELQVCPMPNKPLDLFTVGEENKETGDWWQSFNHLRNANGLEMTRASNEIPDPNERAVQSFMGDNFVVKDPRYGSLIVDSQQNYLPVNQTFSPYYYSPFNEVVPQPGRINNNSQFLYDSGIESFLNESNNDVQYAVSAISPDTASSKLCSVSFSPSSLSPRNRSDCLFVQNKMAEGFQPKYSDGVANSSTFTSSSPLSGNFYRQCMYQNDQMPLSQVENLPSPILAINKLNQDNNMLFLPDDSD